MTRARDFLLDGLVLGFFFVLTLVMTWPLVTQMSTHLAGDDVDVWINPWATWWTKKVLSEGLDFYRTEYLFYPQGTSLVFHSFSHVNTAIALLLKPLVGVVAAQNTTTLLAYVLSGFSMYLLVQYLFQSRFAALVSGIVFAFSPYHIDQILHPVIISTQWIPLFLLFFIRLLDEGNKGDAIAAAVFLLLTALTSWHLFLFTAMLSAVYYITWLIWVREDSTRLITQPLILFVTIAGVTLFPLMWPLLQEWLGASAAYGAAPAVEKHSKSLDLLAFLVPSGRHPLWSDKTLQFQLRTLVRSRSTFIGIGALFLAIYGVMHLEKTLKPWIAACFVFLVLSLGPYPRLLGKRLLTLPWGIPLIKVFRVSHRFHIMTTLTFAVLVGWGTKNVCQALSRHREQSALLFKFLLPVVILFEYLSVPITTLPVRLSPFIKRTLGQDSKDYAIFDLPVGRAYSRYYMLQQIFHGKRIVGGTASRPSADAYAFTLGDPLWAHLLEHEDIDTDLKDVSRHLAYLSRKDIEYIILHRRSIPGDRLRRWRDYFIIDPVYEDESIVVYDTSPQAGRNFELTYELGQGIGLIQTLVTPTEISQGEGLKVHIDWGSRIAPQRDFKVCLTLTKNSPEVAQENCWDPIKNWPTSQWSEGAVGIGDYTFHVDPHLFAGEYKLRAKLIEAKTEQQVGETVTLETITFRTQPRVFEMPEPQHVISETFGQDISLLGYDLSRSDEALRLTLHWKAEHRVSDYYKFFAHLLTPDTSELVAQTDWVPRDWTYPTNWWRAGEVVSDEVEIPLSEVPAGRYKLVLGTYIPDGERLKTSEGEDHIVIDQEMTLP